MIATTSRAVDEWRRDDCGASFLGVRLQALWCRYWFGPGGRIAAAMIRIAIAIAVLMLLDRLRDFAAVTDPGNVQPSIYHPVGVLLVFSSPPPPLVITVAKVLAWGGGIAMLVGLGSRVATVVTALGACTLASQAMSYQPSWSHDLNVVLLALIAFIGARGGDALSIDALVRRWRGRAPPPDASYRWSLLLVQFAVGLMFVSACLLKLRSGGLSWALSDNLRHQLLARYDLLGDVDRPAIVNWLLEDSWRYRSAAVLNLVSQAMPLLAIVFAHRPLVRAFAGVCFVIEVAALYAVMQLANPSWFPLAAVFVDWDALWRWLRRGPPDAAPSPPPHTPRAARIFVACFVTYDLVISFAPRLDQALRTFPFSRFPMFAIIRAKQPYDVHQTYELIGGRCELVADRAPEAWMQAEVDRAYGYRTLHRERDPVALRVRMTTMLAELRTRFPTIGIRGLRLYVTTYQAAAYPAPARLEPHDIAIIGELVDDAWNTHYVVAQRDGRVPLADPALPDGSRLGLFRDGLPVAAQLTVSGGAIELPGGPDVWHVVARLPGADGVVRPYLVARPANEYW